MGYGGAPLTGFSNANNAVAAAETTTMTTLLPPYNNSVAIDSLFPTATAVMKSDCSGITYNLPIMPRKRARDHHHYSTAINRFDVSYPSSSSSPAHNSQKNCGCNNNFYFLGEDISIQIQRQQVDLDRLISQHMEKVRMEVEEKRKWQGRRILEAIELGMVRILRSKEEEIEKIGKLNWELEERVNSLFMENQIWRDVAQTNEATANALRSNLEQVLLQVKNDAELLATTTTTSAAADEESCCGSSSSSSNKKKKTKKKKNVGDEELSLLSEEEEKMRRMKRRCRNCWKEESCVLLLPCRHLCLCNVCGSSLHTCPICNSTNNASVRVIMP